jgi:hypothetical protein
MKYVRLNLGVLATSALLAAGCQTEKSSTCCKPAAAPAVSATAPAAPAMAAPVAVQPVERKIVRIKAGVSAPVTDSAGNVWLADQGFEGGDTDERPEVEIAGTKDQVIYRAEHYSMDSFSWPLANGKYQVKLHFAETYDGITGPGERVFSFTVQGQEFKDFDVWKKAGGPLKAYVETVEVEVTNGKLLIKFTSNVENPEINGIEIIPVG